MIMAMFFGLSVGCEQSGPSRLNPYDQAIQDYRQRRAIQSSPSVAVGSGKMISLLVHRLDAAGEDLTAINSLWRLAEEERITPARAELFTESGFRIGRGGSALRSQLQMLESRMPAEGRSDSVLSVRDGSAGIGDIGTRILIPLFYYKNDLYSRMDYAFDRIDRRLRVVPRILSDDRMELELTPILVNLRNDGGGTYLSDLSVKVVLDPGQSLFFGAANTGRQDIASAFLTCEQNGQKGRSLIVITPTIQEPSADSAP